MPKYDCFRYVGFIGFDDFAGTAHGLNGLADAMRHKPRGFRGDAQSARELVARNALFGLAKQVHRLKPQIHRDVAILENSPNLHGDCLRHW